MLFTEAKRYYVDRRLPERIAATGAQSFQAYFALLRSGRRREIEHLINAFTVNETYFYREDHQLRCLTSTCSPPSSAPNGRASRSASGRSMLHGRGALLHRHLADGEFAPGRRL